MQINTVLIKPVLMSLSRGGVGVGLCVYAEGPENHPEELGFPHLPDLVMRLVNLALPFFFFLELKEMLIGSVF